MKSRAYIQNLLKYSDMLRRQFAAIPTSVWGESAVSSEAFTLMYPSTCTVTSETL